jgi:hypothetical protein
MNGLLRLFTIGRSEIEVVRPSIPGPSHRVVRFPRAAPPVQLCPERIQSLAFADANRIQPSTFRSPLLPLAKPSPS